MEENGMTHDPLKALEAMKTAVGALANLSSDEQRRALRWVAETLGISDEPSVPISDPSQKPKAPRTTLPNQGGVLGSLTPKQFMAEKRPSTDVERIACLAYYLTHARETPRFKTRDLTDLNTEAAGDRFSNAAYSSKNAMDQSGFLAQAGKGTRQITKRGEDVVEALPDREALAAVLAESPKRRRRTGRRGQAKRPSRPASSTK
jgi:hypothetical protein